MPAHMKGCEGNLLFRTQIQVLRMLGLLDGAPGVPAVGHLLCCSIPHSIFSGRTDMTSGFCLRTLSFSRPIAIMWPILDTVIISCTVEGVICEE
jgi:hypothetical protein